MSELVYSTNGEEFNYDLHEAAESVFDDLDAKIGDIRTISCGEKVEKKASDFVKWVVDSINERAYENFADFCDTWPDSTVDQNNELESEVKIVVDKWADKHGLQPTFWGVKNIKETQVRLVSEGEFEEVITNR